MNNFSKVIVIENQIEAQVISNLLQERNIPFYIQSFADEAYGNLFQLLKGWGNLYAPEKYHEEIKEIFLELRSDN